VIGAAALVLAVVGTVMLVVAVAAQKSPPRPPRSAVPASTSSTGALPSRHYQAGPPVRSPPATRGPVLARVIPTAIDIPAIGVHSRLVSLGQNRNGSIEVPPLSRDSVAGWYDNSPTPGQLGPSVILGHVDSKTYGPAVFYRLGALRPGNRITVDRADHTVAVFRVDLVTEYSKNHFPTRQVYGNLDHAGLRLITCGGRFDFSAHSYVDNIVAYASLVSGRAPT